MRNMTFFIVLALAATGCTESNHPSTDAPATAQPSGRVDKDKVDKDNSAVNQRDRDAVAKTPLDQSENKADIAITAAIRKRVVDTKMSINAQNVKIITQDGKVTLRGPVKTAAEKKQIEDIALAVTGDGKVDSQLEVEANP